MKKQTRQSSNFPRKALLKILMIGLIFPVNGIAQTKKVTPKPKIIYWYVDLKVTVKGEGEHKNEDETTISTWSIDRSYSAVFQLNSMEKSGRFTVYEYRQASAKNEIPIKVSIKDLLTVTNMDEGEGRAFEHTTVKTNWEFNQMVSIPNGMKLATDDQLRTYNIFFPIQFYDIKMKSKTVTETRRSNFGHGDEPTYEIDSTKTIGAIWSLPDVKFLITSSAVQQHDFLFPANFTTAWGYDSVDDSPDLIPDRPLFPGIPESKTNVNIRVIYRFSKKPFK